VGKAKEEEKKVKVEEVETPIKYIQHKQIVSKAREEARILDCGCKIGRTGGPWFYDYLCEEHVKEVQGKDGKYSYNKALSLTVKLNKIMREKEIEEQLIKKGDCNHKCKKCGRF